MSLVAKEEIERLKAEVDIIALVHSKGIQLKHHGARDFIGLSPFTQEKNPSFIVSPDKNLWHCMSSGQGGDVFEFLQRYEKITFREAYEKILSFSGEDGNTKKPLTINAPLSFEAEDDALLSQAVAYYHKRLAYHESSLNYLKERGITAEAIEHFKIGYADRTLGHYISAERVEGIAFRQRLKRLGLFRQKTGMEHFHGCVTFPVFNAAKQVREIYGRKVVKQQSSGVYHLYLPGPHGGIFNYDDAFGGASLILTESLIDALSFWCAGIRNVTCIFGTEGFTDELFEAICQAKPETIYLAYDRDEAGERSVKRDALRLSQAEFGPVCRHVKFPHGMDANSYACKMSPVQKSLQVLLDVALPVELPIKAKSKKEEKLLVPDKVQLAANKGDVPLPKAQEKPSVPAASAQPSAAAAKEKNELKPEVQGDDYVFAFGDRNYRVRGLQKNSTLDALRINLRLWCNHLFFVNVLDLYHAKQRNAFVIEAAIETKQEPDTVKRDLGKLLLGVETLQHERMEQQMQSNEPQTITLTEAEKDEAFRFLKAPDMIKQLLSDFDKCGTVGERANKATAWLSCVSRKLNKPLAVIIQSTSAAGKSTLMDAVLSFLPQEEQIKYSAMTGQSLYYLGESNLQHKILAIVEEEGAERAAYALKLLQSEGELTIASTGKDPTTGRMETQEYHVEGPVMIFLTTTAIDIDEELMNRCLVLTVDEGSEQTAAIHERQRLARTLEGLIASEERKAIIQRQQNAQRLLKPYRIVNDFARDLTFVSHRTRARRDHEKYLTLIDAVTLAHQYQRTVETQKVRGESVEFIRATVDDIAIANELAAHVLSRSLDELPPQTRRLFEQLESFVQSRCKALKQERSDYRFTRRELREYTGWSEYQVRVHLQKLEEMEYVKRHYGRQGCCCVYELVCSQEGASAPLAVGLIDVSKLRAKYPKSFEGSKDDFEGSESHFEGTSSSEDAGSPEPGKPSAKPTSDANFEASSEDTSGEK